MFDKLYKNIGEKVKSIALGIFIVETISSIGYGLYLAFEVDFVYIFIAFLGPFAAYVSSWLIYAFGELVEDVHAIRNKEGTTEEVWAKRIAEEKARIEARERANYARAMAMAPAQKAEKQDFPPVELSDDDFIDIVCPNCKSQLAFFKDERNGTCPECGTDIKIN